MKKITADEAAAKIYSTRGKFFRVEFHTRGGGSLRAMTARIDVEKGVTGVGQPYDAMAKGLITVAEVTRDTVTGRAKFQFRNISAEGIRFLKIRGKEYEVE